MDQKQQPKDRVLAAERFINSGHAPGPWDIDPETDACVVLDVGGGIVADCAAPPRLGQLMPGDLAAFIRQQRANARVIAVLPEMLVALHRLAQAAANREATQGDPCRLIECQAELREATTAARAVLSKITEPTNP